jgi:hypothetical protein
MNPARPEDRGYWLAFGAAAILVGLGLRLQLASLAQTPGHGDSAFYFTVAKNIVEGRGLVVDYVVYFFLGLVPITHYAGDFWNPLAEILLSLPMLLLGKSLFNALLASIAAGIVPALVGYFAGKRFGGSTGIGALVGVLTFFTPFLIVESVRTEAIIFYGAFGSVALYLAGRGRDHPRYFLLAALCTGVAHLTRQDAVLLLMALLVCVSLSPWSWRRRLAVGAAAIALHAIMLSPLLIRNVITYGSPLQPGPASTAFMTSYEDFHAYGKEMTWDTLRAEWGVRRVITRRLHTASENLAQVKGFMNSTLLVLASLGVVNLFLSRARPRRLHILVPPLIYWILVYGFYTIVASYSGPGSLPKSLAVLMPFVCILIVDLLVTRFRSLPAGAAAVLILAAVMGYRGYQISSGSAAVWNGVYERYGALRGIVADDARTQGLASQDVIIMARDVWDVHEGTGFRAVMIPNNDLETILAVASHYGADYLLLPAPRPALEDIFHMTTPDPRIIFVAGVPETDWRLFRLELAP